MDRKTATDFVTRIEAHREAEQAIWQELRDHPDYHMHEDKVIGSVIEARSKAALILSGAEADLASFDWVEDEAGEFVPRENA